MSTKLVSCALALMLAACAGGQKLATSQPEPARTGKLDQSLFNKDPHGLSEGAIQAILERPLEIELPARVGILPIRPAVAWHGPGPAHDQASPAVARLAAELRNAGPFTMVTEMIAIPSQSLGMEAMREMAARYKLRYVILYRENLTRRRLTNAWTLGYLTVVGALFMPGDTLEVQGYVEASMFDVKTGLLMFTTRKRVQRQSKDNPWHTDDKLWEMQDRLALDTADELATELRDGIASFQRAVAAESEETPANRVAAPPTAAAEPAPAAGAGNPDVIQ